MRLCRYLHSYSMSGRARCVCHSVAGLCWATRPLKVRALHVIFSMAFFDVSSFLFFFFTFQVCSTGSGLALRTGHSSPFIPLHMKNHWFITIFTVQLLFFIVAAIWTPHNIDRRDLQAITINTCNRASNASENMRTGLLPLASFGDAENEQPQSQWETE